MENACGTAGDRNTGAAAAKRTALAWGSTTEQLHAPTCTSGVGGIQRLTGSAGELIFKRAAAARPVHSHGAAWWAYACTRMQARAGRSHVTLMSSWADTTTWQQGYARARARARAQPPEPAPARGLENEIENRVHPGSKIVVHRLCATADGISAHAAAQALGLLHA